MCWFTLGLTMFTFKTQFTMYLNFQNVYTGFTGDFPTVRGTVVYILKNWIGCLRGNVETVKIVGDDNDPDRKKEKWLQEKPSTRSFGIRTRTILMWFPLITGDTIGRVRQLIVYEFTVKTNERTRVTIFTTEKGTIFYHKFLLCMNTFMFLKR